MQLECIASAINVYWLIHTNHRANTELQISIQSIIHHSLALALPYISEFNASVNEFHSIKPILLSVTNANSSRLECEMSEKLASTINANDIAHRQFFNTKAGIIFNAKNVSNKTKNACFSIALLFNRLI